MYFRILPPLSFLNFEFVKHYLIFSKINTLKDSNKTFILENFKIKINFLLT